MNIKPSDIVDKMQEFDEKHLITDIILLGIDGAVRRINFDIEVVK